MDCGLRFLIRYVVKIDWVGGEYFRLCFVGEVALFVVIGALCLLLIVEKCCIGWRDPEMGTH